MKPIWLAALLALSTLGASSASLADNTPGTLLPPKTLQLEGKTYQPVFSHPSTLRDSWEYTTDGEQVGNWQWTRLLTIIHFKRDLSLGQWWQAIEGHMKKENPTPVYAVEQLSPTQVQVTVIYLPDASQPKFATYESNAWLVRTACGGIVSLQFARQYPSAANEDQAAKLEQIKHATDADLEKLKAMNWQPVCR